MGAYDGQGSLSAVLRFLGHRVPLLPVPPVAHDIQTKHNQQHGRSRVRQDGLGDHSDTEI